MKKQLITALKATVGLLIEIFYALLITGIGGAIALTFVK